MIERRSLRLPITLGVLMIVTVVALTVGWVLLAVFGAMSDSDWAPFYWTLLMVGAVFLAFVLVGVLMYLSLSVKAINLTRRQSNFVDSVTHELKSPIASLKLYLQTLNRRQVSAREQAEFYRFMLDDVERLDDLINHLLDAAGLEKGPADTTVGEVELAGLLRECAATVTARHRLPWRITHLQLEPCLVRARRVDLEMIFRNLIDNAVRYAGDEPRVEVSLRRAPGAIALVRISDNGPGIPAQQRRRVFGRFVRLGLELERRKPGTGLGLYIVRTLVRRLRGQVSIHDRGAESGTVLEVRLPAQPPGQSARETEQRVRLPKRELYDAEETRPGRRG